MGIFDAYAPESRIPASLAEAALKAALQDCAAHGLTGVHDAGSSTADLALLQDFHRRGQLSLRVYGPPVSSEMYMFYKFLRLV